MTQENIFNLDDFFKSAYQYTYTTLEDLLTKPFIEFEGTGANALFWIKINNEKYLFKEIEANGYTWLGELLSKEFADILGIPCAEYKLCKLGNKYGILSKKFTRKNETVILGAQIIQEVLDKYPYLKQEHLLDDEEFLDIYNIPENILTLERKYKIRYVLNNLNNIEQLWSLLDIYLDINYYDKKVLEPIINYLLKTLMFDIITQQADRHIENWAIVKNQDTHEISTAHLFDNSASFGLWDPKLDNRIKNFYNLLNSYQTCNSERQKKEFVNSLYKDRMLLTPSEDAIKNARARKRENNLEIVDYFLKVSSDEFINLFQEYITKIKNVSIENLLTKIETEQNVTIKNEIKQFLIDSISWNLFFLEEKIKSYQLQQGRGKNE